jgi:chromosomal replication initiation ATPase DnaA
MSRSDMQHAPHPTPFARSAAAEIAYVFCLEPELILGRAKSYWVTEARFVLYDILTQTGASMSQVGYWLGRDHGAISHGVKRCREMAAVDSNYSEKVQRVREIMRGRK